MTADSSLAGPKQVVTALLISPYASDHSVLNEMFTNAGWRLYAANTFEEGLDLLNRVGAQVVICADARRDDAWTLMIEAIKRIPEAPKLIASSRLVDGQSQFEAPGAFQVVASPFDPRDLFATVSRAWQAWRHEHGSGEGVGPGRLAC